MDSIVDVCWRHAQSTPDRIAVTFLDDGNGPAYELTYGELWRRIANLGAVLRQTGLVGSRVLLIYTPGLEFVVAFFACLQAGVLPAPVSPPSSARNTARLDRIAAVFDARTVLTTAAMKAQFEAAASPHVFVATDAHMPADACDDAPRVAVESPAFVQFTSGSTGSPKGVVVSHANIVHNERCIALAFGHDEDTVFAGWLPLFHDMGLIGNLLHPLYLGVRTVLMSPSRFLVDPASWLRMISTYGATTSGGPNFAYDYCVSKIAPASLAGVDLSRWRVAFNGSEPVRAATVDSFAAKFGEFGFSRNAFYPCYGLAEATLFVSGGISGEAPVIRRVDADRLAIGRAVDVADADVVRSTCLVGSGRTWSNDIVRIVDPDTRQPCVMGDIGEIWVASASVAQGYWNDDALAAAVFHARLMGSDRSHLRTGDLGFLDADGNLFVTGRLSDLIIVRGRNYYPHDLEATACASHPQLGPTAAAVAPPDARQRIYLFQELRAGLSPDTLPREVLVEIRHSINESIWREHELRIQEIVLVAARSIPKTSSGKVRRHACLAAFTAVDASASVDG